VCLQIVLFFDLFILSFNAAICHMYSVLDKENRHTELVHAYGTVTRWLIMVGVSIYLIIAYSGADILCLISSEFSSGILPLLVLASGYLIKCGLGSAGFILVLCRRQKVETFNAAGAALLNIVLNLLLIPRYGLLGAAIATSISFVIISILRVFQVRYLMHVPTLRISFLRIVILGVAVGLVLTVITYIFDMGQYRGLWPMTIRIVSIGLLFTAGLWFFELTQQEKDSIKDLLTTRSHVRMTDSQ
jgi:O-antigen/teichoic acid export membrane protein